MNDYYPYNVFILAINPERNEALGCYGGEVYRFNIPFSVDIYKLPMGRRWECTLSAYHQARRTVFKDWQLMHD
jgi:hypothetical protein